MWNRIETYQISLNNKQKETQIVNTILRNTGYPIKTYARNKLRNTNNIINSTTERKKWITFTYIGNRTRTITRLFRNTGLRIAYLTNNTIKNHLSVNNRNTDKYSRSGIYELKCNSCPLKYIGQTGRNFRTRYNEHIQAIHYNINSKYAQHILDTGHAYGTIDNTLNILQFEKKIKKMNSLEQFYIYKLTREQLQLNDTHTNSYNPIFDLVCDHMK
jgi:hypothetical protein